MKIFSNNLLLFQELGRMIINNLIFKNYIYLFGGGHMYHRACLEIREQFVRVGPLLSLWSPWDQTQRVIRLGSKHLFPQNHLDVLPTFSEVSLLAIALFYALKKLMDSVQASFFLKRFLVLIMSICV